MEPRTESTTAGIPGVLESQDRLQRAGWRVGITRLSGDAGEPVWVVLGRHGDELLIVSGTTPGVAWLRAVERAQVLGRLGD